MLTLIFLPFSPLVAPTSSYRLGTPPMLSRMSLHQVRRFLSILRCCLSMRNSWNRPTTLGCRCVRLRLWSPRSGARWRLCLIPCGYSLVFWVLCSSRILRPPMPRSLIRLSPLCRRAWPIRLLCAPPVLHSLYSSVGTFICPTYQLTFRTNKWAMLSAPAVCSDFPFAEADIARLLADTQTASSLKSRQAMVDVASRSAGPRSRCPSPRRSPGRRRRDSGSPRGQKCVCLTPLLRTPLWSLLGGVFGDRSHVLHPWSGVCLGRRWEVWELWGAKR